MSNFKEIGYEVWTLTYFDRVDGFLRIIDDNHNYWLDENEIFQKGFKIETWQNFLLENSGELLGFYANEPGLYVRESPDKNSKIIVFLQGDLFEITPIAECIDGWNKVNVKKYRGHPCESNYNDPEIIELELNGWIKIVDDNGRPNVWYYPRGC